MCIRDSLAGGQNLDIGLGALSRGQAPVVDCADGAGAVDVLEIQAVLLDDLAPVSYTHLDVYKRQVHEAVIIDGRVPHSILLELFSNRGSGTLSLIHI